MYRDGGVNQTSSLLIRKREREREENKSVWIFRKKSHQRAIASICTRGESDDRAPWECTTRCVHRRERKPSKDAPPLSKLENSISLHKVSIIQSDIYRRDISHEDLSLSLSLVCARSMRFTRFCLHVQKLQSSLFTVIRRCSISLTMMPVN